MYYYKTLLSSYILYQQPTFTISYPNNLFTLIPYFLEDIFYTTTISKNMMKQGNWARTPFSEFILIWEMAVKSSLGSLSLVNKYHIYCRIITSLNMVSRNSTIFGSNDLQNCNTVNVSIISIISTQHACLTAVIFFNQIRKKNSQKYSETEVIHYS